MSDMGDAFKAMREDSIRKKQKNKEHCTKRLKMSSIPFVSYNDGVHLFVVDTFDYWPSTGLFKHRKSGKSGRGIMNLIKIIKEG